MRKKFFRVIALVISFNIVLQSIFPTIAFALTSGPKSPEFSSFTPVTATNMVNTFTGDFSYNLPIIEIPGGEGGGYAMSLSYNSGVSMEQEASWVGLGFNLSPGFISRSKRGFPDEFEGESIKYFNKSYPSYTLGVAASAYFELFGVKNKNSGGGISVNGSYRINNYTGEKFTAGIDLVGKTKHGNHGLNGNVGIKYDPDNGFLMDANVGYTYHLTKTSEEYREEFRDQIDAWDALPDDEKKSKVKVGLVFNPSSKLGVSTFNISPTSFSVPQQIGFGFAYSIGVNAAPAPFPGAVGASGTFFFNIQFNKKLVTKNVYGYLHNKKALDNDENVMDFSYESGQVFDTRSMFLSIPHANYDIYYTQIEGLSGSFRSYNTSIGHYRPYEVSSKTFLVDLGLDLTVGTYTGIGLTVGGGFSRQKIKEMNISNKDNFSFSEVNEYAFTHDLGGKMQYGQNTQIQEGTARMLRADAPDITSQLTESNNANYIIKTNTGFEITNQDGITYMFDETIKTGNELNVALQPKSGLNKCVNNFYAFFNDSYVTENSSVENDQMKEFKIFSGQLQEKQYDTDYLITSITNNNYVDVNDNGPDEVDFGGWTKFAYRTKHSDFRYRIPYFGSFYNRGSLSTLNDDVGSISTGEKEVKYLAVVETNSHIAFFVTNESTYDDFSTYLTAEQKNKYGDELQKYIQGSGAERKDNRSALLFEGGGDPATNIDPKNPSDDVAEKITNTKKTEYLEKIVLFSKTRLNKPIKTVQFRYSYELVPGTPNNINTFNSTDMSETGKLTLKKVWFEYEGTTPVKIAPYEFKYNYELPNVAEKYSYLYSHLPKDENGTLIQNGANIPYSAYLTGAWGTIQKYGEQLKKYNIPWVYQGTYNNFPSDVSGTWKNEITAEMEKFYDPAAYHLKVIKLPSGGEIHVQYEEKDYQFVQDRPVMAMASIHSTIDDNGFLINVDELGANPKNPTEVQALVDKINEYFTQERADGSDSQKIYYKILYALKNNSYQWDDGRADYISGYADFIEAAPEGEHIRITLTGENRVMLPKEAAQQFYKSYRRGLLDGQVSLINTVESGIDVIEFIADVDISNLKDEVKELLGNAIDFIDKITDALKETADNLASRDSDRNEAGNSIYPAYSFFKLPMLTDKHSEIPRVKRVLMYNTGIGKIGSEHEVYGSEYLYVLENGTSSGVATNEPEIAREENPLVTFLPKEKQKWFSRITAGPDREQFEGPIGKNLLPAASIGYSRVVQKNIHAGETGTGAVVYEYYTVKDYPFDKTYESRDCSGNPQRDFTGKGVEYTQVDGNSRKLIIPIFTGIFDLDIKHFTSAQGYRFVLNDMHGKMKAVTSYGSIFSDVSNMGDYIVSSENYDYYEPGEYVRLWDGNEVIYETPGKIMDVSMASSSFDDFSISFSADIDLGIGTIFPPPIFITVIPSITISDHKSNNHVTNKVLSYPSILRSITSNSDGITNVTEHVVFDKYSGTPVVVKTTNAFNNNVYQTKIPASWVYEEFGRKSENHLYYNALSTLAAQFVNLHSNPVDNVSVANKILNLQSNSIIAANTVQYDIYNNMSTDFALQQLFPNGSITENILRARASYVYKDNINAHFYDNLTNQQLTTLSNSGTFGPISFNYDLPSDEWLKPSEVKKYSPDGVPLEEVNVAGIYSAALYSAQYNNKVPVMISNNAQLSEIYFNSFEDITDAENGFAHTGSGCKRIVASESFSSHLYTTANLKNNGAHVLIWLRAENPYESMDGNVFVSINSTQNVLKKISQTGAWSLYSATILGDQFNSNNTPITITLSHNLSQSLWIDDLRFHPIQAQVSCFVYDLGTYRLLTQFDDNHFGLYYQYNGEGQLIRKQIETEKIGKVTVEEQQYNTPKKNR